MHAPFVEEVLSTFQAGENVVLHAPTGAGKSTLLPLALLQSSAVEGRILLVQPRQLAARAVARRVAELYGCALGEEVGYQVRFDKKASAKTRLLVVTDGIALQLLQRDPSLEGYSVVLLDEFHERSTNLDLLLAFARESQLALREDLRIGVLSATLEVERVRDFLAATSVDATVRRFHLEHRYADSALPKFWSTQGWERAWARWIEAGVRETTGDVLVFLPGVGEIQALTQALEGFALREQLQILQLYGAMPADAQLEVLSPGARRRIVLSTNVAETSLTVPGVDVVMDSGWVRRARLSPSTGLNRLLLERVSRASAEQRAGRAGRLRDGVAYRAWTSFEHDRLDAAETPEIQRVDVGSALMEVLRWQGRDVEGFSWFESPSAAQVGSSLSLLSLLGLVREGAITDAGKRVARLPLHPRLGVLMEEARRLGCVSEAAKVAALLDDSDFPRGFPSARAGEGSDLEHLIALLGGRSSDPRLSRVRRVAAQLERLVGESTARPGGSRLVQALASAFPDRIARRRAPGESRAVMAKGSGLVLDERSSVRREEFFIALHLDASRPGELRCDVAVGIALDELPPALLRDEERYRFDEASGRVEGVRQRLAGALVLEEKPLPKLDRARCAAVLREVVLRDPKRWLGLDDAAVQQWLARWRLVAELAPEEELPEPDDAFFAQLAEAAVVGRRSIAELRSQNMLELMQSVLGWHNSQRIEALAPAKLQVPSGSSIAIDYAADGNPALAVRLQEMFGCVQTPRILKGRLPLVLHLLAPNYRPQQVTEDLAGFWERTYPEVRKELRARYPKHAWPDDPLAAPPQRGPRRRPQR